MKRLLVLLALTGCATPLGERPDLSLWQQACTATSIEMNVLDACGELPQPLVVISQVVPTLAKLEGMNLRGFYFPGELYVFVSPTIARYQQMEVTVHEMVHYIGALKGYEWSNSLCTSEAMARNATYRAGYSLDRTWRIRYGCLIN